MPDFATSALETATEEPAPDGSRVRPLARLPGGGMAHFELPPGRVSAAVSHRTVAEIWYVLSGRGEMWRAQGAREEVTALRPGVCLTIPQGVRFQFRAFGPKPLGVVAVTMPPWPGADEAVAEAGPWAPSPPA